MILQYFELTDQIIYCVVILILDPNGTTSQPASTTLQEKILEKRLERSERN